jgi:hypothetical protein
MPAQVVDRARVDERLEHSLVAQAQIDSLAQVEERIERLSVRAASIDSIAALPTLRIAPRPKRIRFSSRT